MSCPICFEQFNSKAYTSCCDGIVTLIACSHQFCASCLKTFLETCENHGTTKPSCPSCRQCMGEKELSNILGRKYEPAGSTHIDASAEEQGDEIDEFTATALEELGVRICANCGAHILREDGCRAMQCICGFRFCIECGHQMSTCTCQDGITNFAFYDNVLSREGAFGDASPPVARGEEVSNLRSFMAQTHEREQERLRRRAIYQQRRIRTDQKRTEIFSFACSSGDIVRVVGMLRDNYVPSMVFKRYFGRIPLYYAARNGHTAVVKCLLDNGAFDVDGSCLFVASNYACRDMLKRKQRMNHESSVFDGRIHYDSDGDY